MTESRQSEADAPPALVSWVTRQRWYGDKSRQLESVRQSLVATVEIDSGQFRILVLEFTYEDGGASSYLVPIAEDERGEPRDALADERFLRWTAEGFGAQREVATGIANRRALAWRSISGADWAGGAPRLLSGEQSNTSVMLGDTAIIKVFRKLQPGTNPDTEIVEFLTQQGTFEHVPRFLGGITWSGEGGSDPVELAAVQAFIPNEGDAWHWLPATLATAAPAEFDRLLDAISLLGQRTGELHVALGNGGGDPAFAAETYTPDDVAAVERRLASEVRNTASMLLRQGACSYDESEWLAAALLSEVSHAGILEGSFRTRVHGDYHLGQVLRTGDDYVIIDFEGEPSRPMAERRMKASPLKDAAGMLRSIDYAVASATQDADGDRRDSLAKWGQRAERAFISAYRLAIANSSQALAPTDDDDFSQALGLFLIEKALYEVRYELDNRPDWIDIPLGALRRIADGT